METVLKNRRLHQVDGQSISAIANVTGLSRNSVRKYLRQPPSEPPKYRRQQPARPKLGAFEPTLTQWLDLDAKRPKRQRRCARQLFEDLQRQGYQGAYDSIQRFVRDYKLQPAKVAAFVPLTFAAGEAYQFDWREEEVEIGGVVQRVKAAHFRLAHSRQPFVMVFPREIQTMLFAAHDAAFHYFLAYAQSELIAEHPRLFGRDKTPFAPWHYLDLLEHKPGAQHRGVAASLEPLAAATAESQGR